MKKYLWLCLLPGLLLGCGKEKSSAAADAAVASADNASPAAANAGMPAETFTNPIYPNGADPWLEYFEGNYYLTTTTWTSQLVMRKSPTLAGLANATPVYIWSESELERCCNFWAFEFHRLKTEKGYRWYVMYTSGIAENFDRQHLSVIESEGDDPMGPYTYKGSPMPDSWNIDGNYLEHNGQLYLLWSEWVGDEQSIFIARMVNPWTITGERVLIAKPEYEWEKSGMKVNEGPEIIKRNNRTFMVYSASFCNTPDYKLGVIELVGDDPLKPDSWHKFDQPFFSRANGVYGPGHNGFFKSPDGTEDWLIYHGNASEQEGCTSTRSLRAQQFTWTDDDLPFFGEPVASGVPVQAPSGENGPLVTKVQGTQVQLVNKADGQCLVVDAEGARQADCAQAQPWTLDYTTAGRYRLVTSQGEFLSGACDADKGLQLSPWLNQQCQQWHIAQERDGWISLANAQSQALLQLAACVEPAPVEKIKDIEDIPQLDPVKASCAQWRIQPVGDVALLSAQSGKALTAADCSAVAGANVEQDEWHKRACQRWQFVSTQDGFYQLQSSANTNTCMTVNRASIVPGMNVEMGNCEGNHSQWSIDYLNDGTTAIRNRKSQLVLDLANCGVANHTNIAQSQWFNIHCQKFQLKTIP
ncbi:family 43 glycosylhydrolase [Cellvibrio japonicus]|uniref:Beta-xylosidase/alpha-L-arabinfuranosidase, putative, gly43D n=1 Tax=Cellvibrio japonicus (strain Ueda107) TaxID=498211 RepID=B3PKR1_CELJU|nr:family 43 glycosylhydrolase [Cellvibrio japonicus]ACE83962.1 beta-xylosidase/alpha-L-arabinfuranosidase, putative, gly43D [Cellvibrio japonicus Ueda107]QEI11475.1 family 43 glycosylhydrolase [Cellvibrio japonicus]QEI15049.1 family 43 glycosylhydrolase [Cellvibrio japonicus]QEI18629.1 family 43 glycosylhydrolase [Cellvibrio japonicus]